MIDDKKLIADLQSGSADVRFAAWRAAGEASPSAIPEIGKLASSGQPGVEKAAREALTTITHSAGKDVAAPNRAGVVQGLLGLAQSAPLPVKALALRLLSQIAGEDSVPSIAPMLADKDLREEAIYCLERIPGTVASKAIQAAYKDVPEDFKPRILAALGHRRAPEALPLCVAAMRSTDQQVSLAGARALGRIGKRPAMAPVWPAGKSLSGWDQAEAADSQLRYADALAREGGAAEALRIYKSALERPEEHLQCAAIIGLARIGTAEAAAAILPKLKNTSRTVRITAQNSWKSMALAGQATKG